MQIVVLCIFVEGSGDVNCVVGIYNDIADLIAGGNFSCMQIAVAAAGNGDGNCLIGQQDFTGSGVSGIIDLISILPWGVSSSKRLPVVPDMTLPCTVTVLAACAGSRKAGVKSRDRTRQAVKTSPKCLCIFIRKPPFNKIRVSTGKQTCIKIVSSYNKPI